MGYHSNLDINTDFPATVSMSPLHYRVQRPAPLRRKHDICISSIGYHRQSDKSITGQLSICLRLILRRIQQSDLKLSKTINQHWLLVRRGERSLWRHTTGAILMTLPFMLERVSRAETAGHTDSRTHRVRVIAGRRAGWATIIIHFRQIAVDLPIWTITQHCMRGDNITTLQCRYRASTIVKSYRKSRICNCIKLKKKHTLTLYIVSIQLPRSI